MTSSVIKPKPGIYKGVQYRSQLEIAWAKYFTNNKIEFEYVDETYCDFHLPGWYGEFLEVKPKCASLVCAAIDRWLDMNEDCPFGNENHLIWVASGHPPSRYSLPIFFILAATPDREVLGFYGQVKKWEATTLYWDKNGARGVWWDCLEVMEDRLHCLLPGEDV